MSSKPQLRISIQGLQNQPKANNRRWIWLFFVFGAWMVLLFGSINYYHHALGSHVSNHMKAGSIFESRAPEHFANDLTAMVTSAFKLSKRSPQRGTDLKPPKGQKLTPIVGKGPITPIRNVVPKAPLALKQVPNVIFAEEEEEEFEIEIVRAAANRNVIPKVSPRPAKLSDIIVTQLQEEEEEL
ncbi:hypothetical protein PTTG_28963, partial [Puccinia triticina 1-1 BBBD Race 1]